MVGNDIVDLSTAATNSNWQHSRFLDKLFTPREQEVIQSSSNKFSSIWQLWSMKEAAYKAYTQSFPARFFKPASFECIVENQNSCVRYKEFQVFVQTLANRNYVYSQTLTKHPIESKIIRFSTLSYKKQSKLLRQAIAQEVAKKTGAAVEAIAIRKDPLGIPKLYVAGQSKAIQLSLTHHGSFGAYSLLSL